VKLRWTSTARRRRSEIIAHIARDSPGAALRVGDRLTESSRALARHPEMGRLGRVAGTREQIVPGTPYLLVYAIELDTVTIITIVHGAQRWPPP
jgi:toxin ParE1/3/4